MTERQATAVPSSRSVADEIVEDWTGGKTCREHQGLRGRIARAIDAAVAEERTKWMMACGKKFPGPPCACSGCPHERNCRCLCPICNVEWVLEEEREACAKIAEKWLRKDIGNAIRARGQ